MSWRFLQAGVAASWEENSLDGAPDALLKLIPTAKGASLLASAMRSSNHSPSGMTSAPSTARPGADTSTSSAVDSHARTSAQQAEAQASTASSRGSGERWRGSLARYDRDTHSWKTAQYSLAGVLDEFSGTWPRWGLMRDGACWEQMTLAPGTKESASGLLPTLRSAEGERGGRGDLIQAPRGNQNSHFKLSTLTVNGNYNRKGASPRSGDGLVTALKKLPTLQARDWKGSSGRSAKGMERDLPSALGVGQLNPTWLEWFMGWPIGWTELEPLEMDKFQQWLRLHGER
jgi:hypothetical protein